MTTAPIPLCESCARLGPGPGGVGFACSAFPSGVPDEIYLGGFDHRRPFTGDGGVLFELDTTPGTQARLAAYEASRPR